MYFEKNHFIFVCLNFLKNVPRHLKLVSIQLPFFRGRHYSWKQTPSLSAYTSKQTYSKCISTFSEISLHGIYLKKGFKILQEVY